MSISAGGSSSSQEPLRVEARGPSRFFTVEATTGGGSVAVEVVQEGSLRLRTGGGSITVPKVRMGGGCWGGSRTRYMFTCLHGMLPAGRDAWLCCPCCSVRFV